MAWEIKQIRDDSLKNVMVVIDDKELIWKWPCYGFTSRIGSSRIGSTYDIAVREGYRAGYWIDRSARMSFRLRK